MKFDQPTILALKKQLEEIGYANDEQFLGSTAFKHHRQDVFDDLNIVGYSQPLHHEGGFFPQAGAVYWFYDQNMLDRSEALEKTERWVADTATQEPKDARNAFAVEDMPADHLTMLEACRAGFEGDAIE
jgi:hypothetical protein